MTVLYLMHVPWGWIKQRPHFIAEGLSCTCSVTVCCRNKYRKDTLTQNKIPSSLSLWKLFVVPLNRFSTLMRLNHLIMKCQLKRTANKYSHVWITHPDMYAAVKDIINDNHILIYDCMDDALEFPDVINNPTRRGILYNLEARLVNRSDFIFTSSENLKTKLFTRYKITRPINVVNNAISIPEKRSYDADNIDGLLSQLDSIKTLKLIYIGTIAEWLDFDLLLTGAKQYPDITYILIGPAEIQIPEHPQIKYYPAIPHRHIFDVMGKADALIMPFKVNELVLSVNPVKVYEYIYAAKPSIVCRYQETNKFADYVHLYESTSAFMELLRKVSLNKLSLKKDPLLYQEYALQNTWDARVSEILAILNADKSS